MNRRSDRHGDRRYDRQDRSEGRRDRYQQCVPKEADSILSEVTKVVLVAGYQDLAVAHHDFDGLVGQVKAKQVTLDEAIPVAKDADGNARLEDTGDHLGHGGLRRVPGERRLERGSAARVTR